MKFGMNLLLWTTFVDESHAGILTSCKATGFDGVELPLFRGDPEDYRRVGRRCADLGLAVTACAGLPPEANPISPDPKVRRAAIDKLRWAIDCSHAAGAEVLCGPLHSAFKQFSGRGPTEDEFKWSAEVLRAVADQAHKAKVLLAPEALNRFECYLVNTAAQLRKLCELVGHPQVRAHYDTHHMHIEEYDAAAAVLHTAPVLGHVHLSENNRGVPGRGQVDWAGSFAALKECGYDDWVVIESFSRADVDFAAGIHIWRDFFNDPSEVCTDGLRFIRDGLA